MKKLTIVCKEEIQDEVWAVLTESGVKRYTVIGNATRRGLDDAVPPAPFAEEEYIQLHVVLMDDQADKVIEALKTFHDQMVGIHGHKIPFHVEVQPCEVIL
ncbi:MAG: hypothetical protein KGO52_08380 [Nitrospirota bacterium]|nr:hypothetical protein [Nitrospirota bacterium]MDE3242716.1 hypothetical protein [Nitrospirota bacterium]